MIEIRFTNREYSNFKEIEITYFYNYYIFITCLSCIP